MIALLLAAAAATPSPAGGGVTREPYGTTREGTAVDRYRLRNRHGAEVAILTYGGIIDSVSVPDRQGRFANVVLQLPDLATHEARPNVNSIVGRFANRIAGGGFVLDGRRYPLSPDPKAIVIHGGTPGFGERVWRGEPCRPRGCSAVTLRYVSPDGENGFPGRLSVAVTYTLTTDDAIRIDYRATTSRPTVVNFTNHSYFNLAGGGTVLNQRVQILGDAYLPTDARRVPTGEIRSVAGTPFDLRSPTRLADRVDLPDPSIRQAKGLDQNWVLARGDRPALPVVARAVDPASGRTLEVRSSEPGLQLYTAGGFDGSLRDAAGRPIERTAGFAMETQHWPDSPNRPNFPSTVLRPGQTFRSTTIYRFGVTDAR